MVNVVLDLKVHVGDN